MLCSYDRTNAHTRCIARIGMMPTEPMDTCTNVYACEWWVKPRPTGRPKYLRARVLREPFSMNNKSPSALQHKHTHACAHSEHTRQTHIRPVYAENKIRIKVLWNLMVLKYSLRSNVIRRAARHCDGHSWLRRWCCWDAELSVSLSISLTLFHASSYALRHKNGMTCFGVWLICVHVCFMYRNFNI